MNKLPTNWREVALGEVAFVDSGQGAPQGEKYFTGEHVFIRAGDLNNLTDGVYVGTGCGKVTDEAIAKYRLKKYSKNSIVFPKSGMSIKTGHIAILQHDSYVVNHLAIISPKQEVDYLFAYYLLKKIGVQNLVRNESYPSIRISDIQTLKVAIPPLATQKKIVSILEQAEQIKALRGDAEELASQLAQSLFIEMFGDPASNTDKWPVKKINEIIEFSDYGLSKRSNDKRQGYPILGMANITYDGALDLTKYNFVELSDDEFRQFKLHHGDILFNRTNATNLVGKTTWFSQDIDAVAASYLVRLKLKPEVNPVFFSCLLNMPYYKALFMMRCKKAVNQSNISASLLKQFEVIVPPIELQQKFAKAVEQIEQLRDEQKQLNQDSEDLFNALMQKAFRGELVC